MSMLRELVLAIGLPLALLLLAVLVLEQWGDRLPAWLQRLAKRHSWCQATSAFGPLATRKLVHLMAC
jgi:hypothetical protein